MSVGFEHHQETHVSSHNASNSWRNDAKGDIWNSSGYLGSGSGSHSTSPTFPHLRHHHHSRNHGSNGSTSPFQSSDSASSMQSFGNNISSSGSRHFSHKSDSSPPAREAYGENETLSGKSSRFLSPSSSPSQSSSSSPWSAAATGESENGSGDGSTHHHHHQHPHLDDTLVERDHQPNSLAGVFSSMEQINSTAIATNSSGKTFTPVFMEQLVTNSTMGANSYRNFTQNLSFNISLEEMTALQSEDNGSTSYFYNSTSYTLADGVNTTSDDSAALREKLYVSIVPVMLFFCVLAVLVNFIIVISARWCRKPMSPTLYFSISLALADAYAALILATGLVINSLLPYVFKYSIPVCFSLVVEAFRQGGVLVTVSHLLALAMNHWIGIVRPLHYAATMTRRTAWTVITVSWISPITIIFIYYFSVYGEGFQSQYCQNNQFLKERTYRAFFASCFFAPLILMSFIYIHIFIIVRNHHSHRQRFQSTQQLKRNVKAVLTTMLVLGTYVIGWMPATLFSIIVCDNCLYQLDIIPTYVRYSIGFISNLLVILKTLVDPVIYAARMSDIQMALKKMRYDILAKFCKSCAPEPPPNDRGSFYETKSMRMSSFGSRSSTRRTPHAANASLIHHANNGNQMHRNQQSLKLLNQHNGTGSNGHLQGGPEMATSIRSHANVNGGGRRSISPNNQPQPLINSKSKSTFEMTEIN